jgi:sulfatase maturation enzyme AslB (radical SAM superfamily)
VTTLAPPLDRLSLELTGRCQLSCSHCYADSGPTGTHGTMSPAEWAGVIDAAADLGVRELSMIGGEATLHPALPELVGRALDAGIPVEIFTNLVRIPDSLWPTLTRPGVHLATSYYTADPAEHDRITGRRGSHALTHANIVEVLRRGIPLRVNLVGDDETVGRAYAELTALGVPTITRDPVRGFGRAADSSAGVATTGCGRCGLGRAAVLPDGRITPCVMNRTQDGGSVLTASLGELLTGEQWQKAVNAVPRPRMVTDPCGPDSDTPPCGPVRPEPDPN